MRERSYPTILLIGVIACALAFGAQSIIRSHEAKVIYLQKVQFQKDQKELLFSEIPLEAQTAYVYDMTAQEVLYDRSANIPFGIASITKLMTLAVGYPKIQNKDSILISESAPKTEGYSSLAAGSFWSVKDLIALMLVESSNDAAEMIREAAEDSDPNTSFIGAMNAKAKELGMSHTSFQNPTGLDMENTVSNMSSAHDITILAQYVIQNFPELIKEMAVPEKKLEDKNYTVKNTDTILNQIPNIILSKTGYTDYAGGTLVIAYISPVNNHIIISTILGSTSEGRFHDTLLLVSKTEAYFNALKDNSFIWD